MVGELTLPIVAADWQGMTVVGVIGRANVIHVKIGKAKDDTLCSILDDLYPKSRAIFAKSGAIVGGF